LAVDTRLILAPDTVLDSSYRILRVVGSGGFGITYEAEDIKLGTLTAIKEYYPADFADRDATMSVRPKSERHKLTFERGRSNFLQEARTLARFEHPSIVRVRRVFEANATAYMVMRLERGENFELWLQRLGRLPTQAELDRIAGSLLDALELMHAENFLHRDIAPDNIIVRGDGTPVLVDFGSARRTVAEMSRTLTGIVKAGYSPHEQYSSDSRAQGPWSDLYALGGTLYRAVAGRPPEEAALRIDSDQMQPAADAAKGRYRASFLAAIDACLRVRHSERPRSVAQLRPLLLEGEMAQPIASSGGPSAGRRSQPTSARRPGQRWWQLAAAALLVLAGGAYGGFEYARWNAGEVASTPARQSVSERQSLATPQPQRGEADADAQRRQAELQEARRRREAADAAEAEARRQAVAAAEARRREEERIAALEEAHRKAEERRRISEQPPAQRRNEEARPPAEADEERRLAAEAQARRADENRKQEELRLAGIRIEEERSALVRRIQQTLKRNQCYDGGLTGRSDDAQVPANKFVDSARKRGSRQIERIELAKASVGELETWLRAADLVKTAVCAPQEQQEARPPPKRPVAKVEKAPEKPQTSARPAASESASGRRCAPDCWNVRNRNRPRCADC
jgi:tRNA A-37 threonylcarbamoyl transferase component Bud32